VSLAILRKKFMNETKDSGQASQAKENPEWSDNIGGMIMTSTTGYNDYGNILNSELEGKEPVEIFEKLFDEDVSNHIVIETNRYSNQKNYHSCFVSKADIKQFIGILMLSGYNKLPRERLHWSLDEDVGVKLVSNVTSRNRFQEINQEVYSFGQ
jgi:hypothetical protein